MMIAQNQSSVFQTYLPKGGYARQQIYMKFFGKADPKNKLSQKVGLKPAP
jgi:hypothetical protein